MKAVTAKQEMKARMTVKEIAELAGCTSDSVRYYTRLGLLHPKREAANHYRIYSSADFLRLRFIKQAKGVGFSLSDIAAVFSDVEQGVSPCPRVRELLKKRLQESRQQIETLRLLQGRMEEAELLWSFISDGMPSDKSICCLIEALDA